MHVLVFAYFRKIFDAERQVGEIFANILIHICAVAVMAQLCGAAVMEVTTTKQHFVDLIVDLLFFAI